MVHGHNRIRFKYLRYVADSIDFRPFPTTKTQDPYVLVTQLGVHGRRWAFTGVIDGNQLKSAGINTVRIPVVC